MIAHLVLGRVGLRIEPTEREPQQMEGKAPTDIHVEGKERKNQPFYFSCQPSQAHRLIDNLPGSEQALSLGRTYFLEPFNSLFVIDKIILFETVQKKRWGRGFSQDVKQGPISQGGISSLRQAG